MESSQKIVVVNVEVSVASSMHEPRDPPLEVVISLLFNVVRIN